MQVKPTHFVGKPTWDESIGRWLAIIYNFHFMFSRWWNQRWWCWNLVRPANSNKAAVMDNNGLSWEDPLWWSWSSWERWSCSSSNPRCSTGSWLEAMSFNCFSKCWRMSWCRSSLVCRFCLDSSSLLDPSAKTFSGFSGTATMSSSLAAVKTVDKSGCSV